MSELQDFLNSMSSDITDDVAVSERFVDKKGNLLKFKIKSMGYDDYESARIQATIMPKRKNEQIRFDSKIFNDKIIINNVIDPNFKDAESIKKKGCATPEQYLHETLLPGEINELANKISALSGFDKDFDEEINEAKN